MTQLRLTEIWIYPVKSLGGFQVNAAKVFEKGLWPDRRWMLVDENFTFLTQRIHPTMALFKVNLDNDTIYITFSGNKNHSPSEVSFNVNEGLSGETISASVWNDKVDVNKCSQKLSDWFTSILGFTCFLVRFPENNPRSIDSDFNINDQHVSLADAYPFLIIGESSLADLNSRLQQPVPMNRFRPNFVFSGGRPYEEEQWKTFRIGDNAFVGVKPCARCVLTTVNQETAEKGTEPLATLSGYRRKENKVLFGQNVISLDRKEIRVGDLITVDP